MAFRFRRRMALRAIQTLVELLVPTGFGVCLVIRACPYAASVAAGAAESGFLIAEWGNRILAKKAPHVMQQPSAFVAFASSA